MAIIKQKSKVKADTTHFDNLEKVEVKEQSKSRLKNSQESEMLIDPEDKESGSTHTSIKASAAECPDDVNDEDKGPGPTTIVSEEADDSDEEAEGTQAAVEEDEAEEESDAVLENAEEPAELEVAEDDVKGPGATTIVNNDWDAASETVVDDMYDDLEEDEDEVEDEDDEEDEEVLPVDTNEMECLLDVDGTDDDSSNTVFAAYGNKLMVIKGNRIIATMNKQTAIKSGHLDVYLSDQFEQVVASELFKKGLRAGLKSMGFSLATVNVAAQAAVNLRVQSKVKAATANIHKVVAAKEKAFQDSMAIAVVGLNRGSWKDISNPLKASLQEELTAAGVRNAKRLVHNVFAEHGISYAKAIYAMASRLAEMPQESRNDLTKSLDMTNEMEDEDMDLYAAEEKEPEFDDEDTEFGHYESDATVASTLTTAGYKNKTVSHKATQYSVNASDVLSGKAPLPLFI